MSQNLHQEIASSWSYQKSSQSFKYSLSRMWNDDKITTTPQGAHGNPQRMYSSLSSNYNRCQQYKRTKEFSGLSGISTPLIYVLKMNKYWKISFHFLSVFSKFGINLVRSKILLWTQPIGPFQGEYRSKWSLCGVHSTYTNKTVKKSKYHRQTNLTLGWGKNVTEK